MNTHAHSTPSSAAASAHALASLPLALLEARQLRDTIAALLRREQAAMADFLIALADFDRRRGWEPLGHANLFAFLHVELRLSKSAAFYRTSAAELLQRFPEVIEPLREGHLCLSTVAELAKVLTAENRAVVTPRFFGLSVREAQELVAEFQPRQVPSTRMVVTRVLDRSVPAPAIIAQPPLTFAIETAPEPDPAFTAGMHPTEVPPSRVLTSDFANGGGGRLAARRDEFVPLTADLRRVHFNICKRVVKKLEAAREGFSHSICGATMEQVLEAALDLLLEKQARARGQVKKPRKTVAPGAAPPTSNSATEAGTPTSLAGPTTTLAAAPLALVPSEPRFAEPLHRRTGPREALPVAVRRAIWARDQGRCAWPLDSGGVCGSTHRLELDHVVPWARDGEPTEANLRLLCHRHNALAARLQFGEAWMRRYTHSRTTG
jgi:hypothetical protein